MHSIVLIAAAISGVFVKNVEENLDSFRLSITSARPTSAEDGIAVRHALAEGRQIGRHAIVFLRTAKRHAEAGTHLVQNEPCAVFVRQILDALRNAGGLGAAPVVPAVVAPADDLVPAGMDSGEAHGRRRGIRAGFTQVYPLRARDHVHQKLCQLRLDRTRQRGHKAVSDLGNGLPRPLRRCSSRGKWRRSP